jgi:pyruvate formate-lyase activating enzyme-like uncharacterized protein
MIDIKNSLLFDDLIKYVKAENTLINEIRSIGLDILESNEEQEGRKKELISKLREKGAIFRNNDKSVYINSISFACLECRKGDKSKTFFYSLSCNRNCYFCSNLNQENYEENVRNKRNIKAEFDEIKNYKNLQAIAVTGGEPLMNPEEVYSFFRYVNKKTSNIHKRLYTNGDYVNEKILKKLQSVGLNEIRFSLKPEDFERYGRIIEKLSLSKKYIKDVMVEMPVIPNTLSEMKAFLSELERIKIYGVNLLEFLFPWKNPEEYKKRGFKIKSRPYEVLYSYTYAGGLPINGSEEECLELLLFALENNFKIGIHYCSLENKLTSQIYNQNANVKLMPYEVFSDKDFFIKTAKVYGEDAKKVIEIVKDKNEYTYDENKKIVEFHPKHIKKLPAEVEVAISYNVVEELNGQKILREIKLYVTNSDNFDYIKDI